MEKQYTVEDMQNIIRQEQERWAAWTRVKQVYIKDTTGGRHTLQIVNIVQTADGVVVEVGNKV